MSRKTCRNTIQILATSLLFSKMFTALKIYGRHHNERAVSLTFCQHFLTCLYCSPCIPQVPLIFCMSVYTPCNLLNYFKLPEILGEQRKFEWFRYINIFQPPFGRGQPKTWDKYFVCIYFPQSCYTSHTFNPLKQAL